MFQSDTTVKRIWIQFLTAVSTKYHSRLQMCILCDMLVLGALTASHPVRGYFFLVIYANSAETHMIRITSTWQHHTTSQQHFSSLAPMLEVTAHVCPSWQQNSPQGVTLFLEKSLDFHDTVHFHGDLAVVALRPLDFACVGLGGEDAFVEPGAVLLFVGCQNNGLGRPPCACMETSTSVGSSTFATPGPSLVEDPWAEVFVAFFLVWIIICDLSFVISKLPKGLSWGWIRTHLR